MKRKRKTLNDFSANKWKAGGIIAALVAAVAVFAVMLQMEKSVLTRYERGTVYVAVKTIPRGQLITEKNYGLYMKAQELERSCISETALYSPEQITGLAARFDVEPGVLLTEGMFEEISDILEEMKEPVVAGFKADDLYQVVGGVLRAGDRIHIYRVSEDNETVLVWGDVYVQGVFDQAGTQIVNGDTVTAAQRINIYMDKADVESFYSELASGTLRVVKVYR